MTELTARVVLCVGQIIAPVGVRLANHVDHLLEDLSAPAPGAGVLRIERADVLAWDVVEDGVLDVLA